MKKKAGINRREFVKTALAGSAIGVLPVTLPRLNQEKTEKNKPIEIEYRKLGKTNLKVSAIGMGVMRTSDPAVIHHAIDSGINYFDTAHCYMNGNNEPIVGTVLKTRRKEVIIATKVHIASETEMIASVESSLKNLQTDVIDIIQLHSLKEAEHPQNEEAMNALSKLRQRGLVRFLGFTTHKNQAEVMAAGLETNFYDTILVTYSYKTNDDIAKMIDKAAKAGLGIIAMKTQQGGFKSDKFKGMSPHQAALRWVLQNKNIATTIPSMVAFAHVDENVGTMREKFGATDQKALDQYGQLFEGEICNFCGSCDKLCPNEVPVQDINRCLMYAKGYRDFDLALNTYRELHAVSPVTACVDCSNCIVHCESGLNIPRRLQEARELFNPVLT